MLLTHGWSLDSSAWDYVLEPLAARYRVVVWDLPGLGDSTPGSRKEFSIEHMAADLEAVRRAVKTDSHLIMVGHSIGGMILQTWCQLYPRQLGAAVQGIVLLQTTYTNPLKTNVAAWITTLLQYPVIVPLNWLMIAVAPLVWLSNWQSYRNGSLHLTTRFTSFSGRQTREHIEHAARLTVAAWPATIARGNLAMTRFNGESILPEIGIPVLVVSGKHDRMTVSAASEQISRLLPNDRPFSLDSGHLGLFECSAPLTEILCEFTERLLRDSDTARRATDNAPKNVSAATASTK